MLIDDFSANDFIAHNGRRWMPSSDRVMGGISDVACRHVVDQEGRWLRLSGDVRLENNGGFVSIGLELGDAERGLDCTAFEAIALDVRGNGETYGCHLRTPDCARPWQSYRASFKAGRTPATIVLPFTAFEPHRVDRPLDLAHLRRLSLICIGRAIRAELDLARVELVPGPS